MWVIGGAEVYSQAMPLATRAVVTEIDADYEGDAFAPELDASWQEASRTTHVAANGLAAISAERVTCWAMLLIDAVSSSVADATVSTLVEAWLEAVAAAAPAPKSSSVTVTLIE